MVMKWFPWRFLLRHAAEKHGFLDPLNLMARLQSFAQPAEIAAPLELVRAGAVFHARGLINSQAIQHNLDWVWPYWVECQFNPKDSAFIPRAFSITHVNLTHRNWTAVGLPDSRELPIVDPRGLVTPFFDGWSVDAWILPQGKEPFIPSRQKDVTQTLVFNPLSVKTTFRSGSVVLKMTTRVALYNNVKCCIVSIACSSSSGGKLAVSLRPYNPEGISFIDTIVLSQDRKSLVVNDDKKVLFSETPTLVLMSSYAHGDVLPSIAQKEVGDDRKVTCTVGMATAVALFQLSSAETKRIDVMIPLKKDEEHRTLFKRSHKNCQPDWDDILESTARVAVPDTRIQFLYDAAVRSVILHSNNDVYPGPYTYKRFWFRDAAFILNALLCLGLGKRVAPIIRQFPRKQTSLGYFLSQEGEWDSNGEALWVLNKYYTLTRDTPSDEMAHAVIKGARWIMHKRLSSGKGKPHAGLFPAGFSAEHLGPNDYYYWDDFWGVAGLRAAAELLKRSGKFKQSLIFEKDAELFMEAIEQSLLFSRNRLQLDAIPASPYRRLDAGAVGSLVASYPLQLFAEDDHRINATLQYLHDTCLIDGAFFHDLTHSGINAYLTIHMAQAFLRAGDPRYWDMVQAVADFASPTGQWPEAIHPITRGGCMGDGQHIWAAAEWILMIRAMFVREEGASLILCSGIPDEWFAQQKPMMFGPTMTCFGAVSVHISFGTHITISWSIEDSKACTDVRVVLPNGAVKVVSPDEGEIQIYKKDSV